jgi:hypothetical protein
MCGNTVMGTQCNEHVAPAIMTCTKHWHSKGEVRGYVDVMHHESGIANLNEELQATWFSCQ